jgi:hypothetical protein
MAFTLHQPAEVPSTGTPRTSPWAGSRSRFRIKLRWAPQQELRGIPDCWEEVPERASTIADLSDHIVGSLISPRMKTVQSLLLCLDGFLLRPESSILVLRDGDLLDVALRRAQPEKNEKAAEGGPKTGVKRARRLASGVAVAFSAAAPPRKKAKVTKGRSPCRSRSRSRSCSRRVQDVAKNCL